MTAVGCDESLGLPFYAREYRSPLRFRDFKDYTTGTLAAAARASASFPGAFEPQKLYGDAARLAGFPNKIRWAIDGGLLENAPIKPAIELIPQRRSSGPVKRFVCYVNAAPTAAQTDSDDPGQPSLAKVISYTINLPRDGRVIDQLERALAIEVIRRSLADDFDIESADPLNVAQLTPLIDTPLFTFDAEHREPGKQRVPNARGVHKLDRRALWRGARSVAGAR